MPISIAIGRFVAFLIAGIAVAFSCAAEAWWDEQWTQRMRVGIDTTASGVLIKEPLKGFSLAVRLHSGNFDFTWVKPDGSDLRVIAADDKTVLAYHVELFDAANELALIWVQAPALAPNSTNAYFWLYSGNLEAGAAGDVPGTYDAAASAVFHFSEKEGLPKDATSNLVAPSAGPARYQSAGLLGGSAVFEGEAMVLPDTPALRREAGAAMTFSTWLKPAPASGDAVLFRQQSGAGAPLVVAVEQGKLAVRMPGAQVFSAGEVKPGVWQHLAVTAGADRIAAYVNGVEVGSAAGTLPAVQGEIEIGAGLQGELDELQLASAARSADWIKAAAGAEGADAQLVAVSAEETEAAGGHSYFGILVDNLTADAWVVIIILIVMFVIACMVMVSKTLFVSKTDKFNRAFLTRFRQLVGDLTPLENGEGGEFGGSSLYRLYRTGIREMSSRMEFYRSHGHAESLTPQAIEAIKASVDAEMVRENHQLNKQMVLLTIAISGGPFLGLLGTVVGVMITFAAIAAAGDVNVNAIAPGIAAALLATVAGLAVAIPALFGYNYLASRIKNISADMQVFADELVTKLAENYSS